MQEEHRLHIHLINLYLQRKFEYHQELAQQVQFQIIKVPRVLLTLKVGNRTLLTKLVSQGFDARERQIAIRNATRDVRFLKKD